MTATRECREVKRNHETCGKPEKRVDRWGGPLCGVHARAAEARGESTWEPGDKVRA